MKTAKNKGAAVIAMARHGRKLPRVFSWRAAALLVALFGACFIALQPAVAQPARQTAAQPASKSAADPRTPSTPASTRASGASLATAPVVPDLLMHGSPDTLWIAQITRDPLTQKPQTQIQFRHLPSGDWQQLQSIPTRIVGLANQGSDLIVLMESGDWARVAPNRFILGTPLPHYGPFLCISNEGDKLWALGRSSPRGSTTQPENSPATAAASTLSADVAKTTAPSELAARNSSAVRLWSFGPEDDHWQDVGPAPADLPVDGSPISLAVIDGKPNVAFIRNGALQVLVFHSTTPPRGATGPSAGAPAKTAELPASSAPVTSSATDAESSAAVPGSGDWQDVGLPPTDVAPLQFKLLSANRLALWLAGNQGAGQIFFLHDRQWLPAEIIPVPTPPGRAQERAIGVGGDKIHVLIAGQGKFYEQVYSLSGQLSRPWAQIAISEEQSVAVIALAVEYTLLALLVLVGIGTIMRRRIPVDTRALEATVRVAPLNFRLSAGLIDLWPLLLILWFNWQPFVSGETISRSLSNPQNTQFWNVTAILHGVYLLYTCGMELIFGRTIGKMLFGLRVVSVDGGKPKPWALLSRNVLRMIDLSLFGVPLLLIFFTPLRQRIGDAAAGTVVVESKPAAEAGGRGDRSSSGKSSEESAESFDRGESADETPDEDRK